MKIIGMDTSIRDLLRTSGKQPKGDRLARSVLYSVTRRSNFVWWCVLDRQYKSGETASR